jgi:hypothetical protein
LGGVTAGEVESKLVNDTLQEINAMGITKDSEKFTQLAKRFAAVGLNDKAQLAAQEALKAREKEVKIAKDEADLLKGQREQEQKDTALTGRINYLNTLYADDPNMTQDKLVYGAMDDKTFEALVKAKEPQKFNFGEAAERYAQSMFKKDFGSLTQEQQAAVNDKVQELKRALVQNQPVSKISELNTAVNLIKGAVEPIELKIKNIGEIRSFLSEANAGNSVAQVQLGRALSQLQGRDQVSFIEAKNILGNSGFVDDSISAFVRFVNGDLTQAKRADIKKMLDVYETALKKQYNERLPQEVNLVVSGSSLGADTKKAIENRFTPYNLSSPTTFQFTPAQLDLINRNLPGAK